MTSSDQDCIEFADQRERAFAAAILDTLAALVVVLDTQGRILRFNQACERLTGYSADEVRGRYLWDLFLVSEEEERVMQVFQALTAGNFPNQAENYWLTRDGQRRLISWSNTAVLDSAGAVHCVVATGIDITEQRAAETELERARAHLERQVQKRTGELQEANEFLRAQVAKRERTEADLQQHLAFEELITSISTSFINLLPDEVDEGIDRALERVGRFAGVDRSYVFQYSRDGYMENTHEWAAPGIPPQLEHMSRTPIKALGWTNEKLLRGEVLYINDASRLPSEAGAERQEFASQGIQSLLVVPMTYRGSVIGFIGFDSVAEPKTWTEDSATLLRMVGEIIANALEHKRALSILDGQRQFLELLARGGSLSGTLHTLVRIIEEQWPGMLGLVLILDEDGQHLHVGAYESLPDEYMDSIEGLEIGPMVGSCGTACYCKERVSVEDILSDSRWDGLRSLAVKYGLGACWSEPVTSPEGDVIATFAMYYREPRAPIEAELRTIEVAAHLVGVAIEHDRARQALQRSEERFRAAAESANDLIYELDTQTGNLEWFGDVDAKLGYAPGSFPRTVAGYLRAIHPEDSDQVMAAIEQHLRSGEPYRVEYRVRCQEGQYRYWRDQGSAFWDERGSPYKLVGATSDITERVLAYQTLEESVEERTHELSTLLAVSHTVASTLELEPLLGLILDQLRMVVDYVGASVMRLDGDSLVVQAYRGVIDPKRALQVSFSLEKEVLNRQVIEGRKPIIVPHVQADTPLARAFRASAAARPNVPFGYISCWMGVPLQAKDRVIGMLSFDHSQPNFYTQRDAELAMAFANEAALAIENARLYEQAQELAAVEERQRLARDLHDSVTQSLYGVTLYAEAASRLMSLGNTERATEYLGTLGETAREALREMRLLIFQLRPPLLEQEGLVAAMQGRLEAVEGRAGLQVEFSAEGDLDLPFDMQRELYRIGQEALNNVLKHANARMVSVRLARQPGQVTLEVQDDGKGFDLSQRGHGLGLPGMAERVELLKGKCDIQSAPGQGTQVRIAIPLSDTRGDKQ